ncbi:sensor histidine kinase [Nonomuraea fuscirosea]|uniref:sensor histidine kinase n=1 Tax=Nonomuraea fuscirosea TaxID=1291556 RepID=UPI002DDB3001|nr:sensor histidine kinase [Nonomuraea fuscirosea]WSA50813.1 sensor histidine kinase [Nonomuraea fuscirosea]
MTDGLRPPLLLRLRPAFLLLGDVALAVFLTSFAVLAVIEQFPLNGSIEPLPVLAGVLMGVPLAVRRRWPVPALAVVSMASILAVALRWMPPHAAVVPDLLLVFAIYPVAVTEATRRAVAALVLSVDGFAGAVLFAVAQEPRPDWGRSLPVLVTQIIVPVAVWVVGRAVRARREHETRAVRQVLTDERLRIARDLHDGVAHSLSLITVQASVALHVGDERPDEARSALTVIEDTSREAARELRRMLGLLRAVDEDPQDAAQLEPAPTADRLAELADHATAAGAQVALRIGDGIDTVPATIGLAAYRIVQESLTNVIKHAAPARCVVRVDRTDNAMEIEVTDDGRRALIGHPAGGHGLIGMRERVAVYGGDFSAGPVAGRGFRVHARLPLEGVPA